MLSIRARSTIAVLGGAATLLLVMAAGASATAVLSQPQYNRLVIVGSSAPNDILVYQESGNKVGIKDDKESVTAAGPGCTKAGRTAVCPIVDYMLVDVGAGNDYFKDQWSGSANRLGVFGGTGNDTVISATPLFAALGDGNDKAYGGFDNGLGGPFTGPGPLTFDNMLYGQDGDDKLYGTPGQDYLEGGPDRDRMFGYGGGYDYLAAKDGFADYALKCGGGSPDRIQRDSFDPGGAGCEQTIP